MLSAEDFEYLRPRLQTMTIAVRQVLVKAGKPLEAVYFLNGGVASITKVLTDGAMVEVATVGDEGIIGIEALLNEKPEPPGEVLVQVSAENAAMTAERLAVRDFREALERRGGFRDLMGRYAQMVFAHMMQSTACNARHPVSHRCARSLLQTHDRIHGNEFELSQEFLAVMLGVQRPTVTVAAGMLQKAGLIRYSHGKITVLDRSGLEAASCECYEVIRKHSDRLLGTI